MSLGVVVEIKVAPDGSPQVHVVLGDLVVNPTPEDVHADFLLPTQAIEVLTEEALDKAKSRLVDLVDLETAVTRAVGPSE